MLTIFNLCGLVATRVFLLGIAEKLFTWVVDNNEVVTMCRSLIFPDFNEF